MNKKEADFYTKIRSDIKKWIDKNSSSRWADYLLLTPDIFHLLCKLSLDKSVPKKKKIQLAGVIAYFISPIDLMPEALLGPFGFLDDIALAAYFLNDLINDTDPQVVLKHWAGDTDLLYLVKNILINSQDMLGAGLVKKLKNKFNIKS